MTIPPTNANIKAPFDSLTLRAVVAELRARLIGGQVQDIRQPSAAELRLGIRSQGQNHILALSCDSRFARAHLTTHRPPTAAVPPSFCMAIRKHCEGAVIRDVRQRGFDRVLEIEIGTRSSESDSGTTTLLIAELMGNECGRNNPGGGKADLAQDQPLPGGSARASVSTSAGTG